MLKPGGTLIIDHRNYDFILKHGKAPKKNIYYNSKNISSIKTQIVYENNKPKRIVLDYKMDVEGDGDFILSYQPYKMTEFTDLLKVCSCSNNPHKSTFSVTHPIPGSLWQGRQAHHLRRLLPCGRHGRPGLLHPRAGEAEWPEVVGVHSALAYRSVHWPDAHFSL
jgi:hypothetical protein